MMIAVARIEISEANENWITKLNRGVAFDF